MRTRVFTAARHAMLAALPAPAREEFARRRLRLPDQFPSDLRIRIARSKEELEAAFRLIHESAVDEGLLEATEKDLLITKYHALPSTTTLVAIIEGRVVGTASLIRTNAFGSPAEDHPDIAFLKESGSRIAELTSLAISWEFRDRPECVFFPLFKGILDYASRSFGTEAIVTVVPQRKIAFYEQVLLFERLDGVLPSGQVAVLKTNHLHERYAQVYERRPQPQNLAKFFALETDAVELPPRQFNKLSDPVWTPKLFDYFFRQRSNVFESLTNFERQVLFDVYDNEAFRAVLPRPDRQARELMRKDKRHEVKLPSRIFVPNKGQIGAIVRNVSEHGLLVETDRALREGERYKLNISLDEAGETEIEGVVLRNEVKRRYAVKIVHASSGWIDLINYLERDLLRA